MTLQLNPSHVLPAALQRIGCEHPNTVEVGTVREPYVHMCVNPTCGAEWQDIRTITRAGRWEPAKPGETPGELVPGEGDVPPTIRLAPNGRTRIIWATSIREPE
jgi:hypothetical protein